MYFIMSFYNKQVRYFIELNFMNKIDFMKIKYIFNLGKF